MHILTKNFAANAVGQMVIVLERVALVPLYLAAWGIETYGAWLAIAAIPGLFASTGDFGVVPVAGNEMAMSIARGENDRAITLYQSAWAFVSLLSLILFGAFISLVLVVGPRRLLGLEGVGLESATALVCLVFLTAALNFQHGLQMSALRAVGRIAEGTYAANSVRVLQIGLTAGLLLLGATPLLVAAMLAAVQAASIGISRLVLHRYAPWLPLGVSHVKLKEIRRILAPSVSFLGFPIGGGILLQGLPLVISHALGPAAVAVFVTTRTLTKFLVQFVGAISWSAWPEISRHYGAGDRDQVARYFAHGLQATTIVAAAGAVGLTLFYRDVFNLWTGGALVPGVALIVALSVAAFFESLSSFPATVIIATNRFAGYSALYLLLPVAVVGVAPSLIDRFGLHGAAIPLCGVYLIFFGAALILALRTIGRGIAPLVLVFRLNPLKWLRRRG